jgi:hypothetical protein
MTERTHLTSSLDPGLALRFPSVARRVEGQHQKLQSFASRVTDAIERGSLTSARAAFTSFADALSAHISLEDQTVFPALRGLSPELAPDLTRLAADHNGFRTALDELHDLLARGWSDEFGHGFRAFLADFTSHEQREEKVVARGVRA